MSDTADRDTAAEIHRRIKDEFERLERSGASRMEWISFANRLVEAVMACQKIVLEHQSRLVPQPGSNVDYQQTRQASRDALQALDGLSSLYQRIRLKLGY